MAIHKLFPYRYSAWSWHCRPSAVRHVGTKDQTLWAPITDTGVYLCAYNHATGEYSEASVGNPGYDDHNNASILVRADGHIVVAWTGHVVGQLNFRKTTVAEDISSLGTTFQVTAKPSYSYVQLVELTSEGKIFCFCRRNWTSSDGGSGLGITTEERVWDILISSDGGATFAHHSVPLCFEADGTVSAPYTEPYSNGVDTIWFARSDWMSGALSMAREDVIFFKYVSGSGGTPGNFYKADGTLICAWSALPIMDKSALEIVYDTSSQAGTPATFVKDIIADITSGDITIAFTTMDTATEVNTYRTARWNGTTWVLATVVEAGYDFTNDVNQPAYEGGIIIDPSDTDALILSREQTTGGGHWELERWETSNGGSSWAKTQDITAGDTSLPAKIVRPMAPRGYASELPLFFMGGTYETFTNFQTESYAITSAAFERELPSGTFAADFFDDHGTTFLSGTSHPADHYDNTWVKHPSYTEVTAPPVADGTVNGGDTEFRVLLDLGTPSSAEYSVSTTCRRLSTADGRHGVVGRMLNSTGRNGYGARLYPTNSTVELYKYVNNVATLLDSASFAFGVNDSVVLTLELFDSAKRVLIDGVEYCSSTDNSQTGAGYPGVMFSSGVGMALEDFWAFTATSGPTTETLDTLITSISSAADRQAYRETVDTLITSGATVDAVTGMVEALLSLGVSASTAADVQGYADGVSDTIVSASDTDDAQDYADGPATTGVSASDETDTQAYTDSLADTLVSASDVTDTTGAPPLAESLLTTAVSASNVSAAQAYVETVTALAVSASSLGEVLGLVEQLGTVGESVSTVSDRQLYYDNVAIVALSSSSLAEVGAYIEQVSAAAVSASSLTDVLVGSFVGRYVFVDVCRARSFEDTARPRSFIDYCRPRGRTLQ